MVILLHEQNLTDIKVHKMYFFQLVELRDYFGSSVMEQFRSARELLRCNVSGVVSVQYGLAAALIFSCLPHVFIYIKGHEGNSIYSFGTASAGWFSYTCYNCIGKRNHSTETEWKTCKLDHTYRGAE